MNNSYITIIKEKRTALSRKRIPLNQNGCTANFRISVPFEQNLHNGEKCPICSGARVIAGINDLATTDNQLLSEWDYEQNKLKPTEVSRTSAKRAWWKCRHGHSWSMKINERTILNKGCRICEQEYLSLFPALAVSYYSNKKGLQVMRCRRKGTYIICF